MKKILSLIFLTFMLFSCKKDAKKVSIVLDWQVNTNHTGLIVAKEKGYFKDLGIDLDIVIPTEDSAAIMVSTGKYDFGISFQDSLAYFYSKNEKLPITTVAAILQENTSGIISLKEKNIKSFKDLENKNYASWQDNIEQGIIKTLMEQDNADYSTLNILPYSYDILPALKTNIDATWVYYAHDGIALESKNVDFNFLEIKKDPTLNYYSPVLIANTNFIKNKELTKNILKAIEKGYRFAIENPEEATNIVKKAYPEINEDIFLKSQKWINQYYLTKDNKWGYIDKDRWNNFFKWVYDNNLVENPIEIDYGFTNDFLE